MLRRFGSILFLMNIIDKKEVGRVQWNVNNSDNIYIGRIGENKIAHENAMQSISERFASEYEGTLSEGEEKKTPW